MSSHRSVTILNTVVNLAYFAASQRQYKYTFRCHRCHHVEVSPASSSASSLDYMPCFSKHGGPTDCHSELNTALDFGKYKNLA